MPQYKSNHVQFRAVRYDGKNVDEILELIGQNRFVSGPENSIVIDDGKPKKLKVRLGEFVFYNDQMERWETMEDFLFLLNYAPVFFGKDEAEIQFDAFRRILDELKKVAEEMKASCNEATKEATAYPFWTILYADNNEWYAGPFFSREAAEEYRQSVRPETRDKTYVVCLSGKYSSAYEKLIDLVAKFIPGGNPG